MNQSGELEFCKEYMEDGEYILWSGKPDKGNLLEAKDGIFIPLGTGFVLLTLFFLNLGVKYVSSVILTVFLILCLAFELEFFGGRIFLKARRRKKTLYVVTNKRIFIRNRKNCCFFRGENLPPMEVKQHRNKNVTISFGRVMVEQKGSYVITRECILENLIDAKHAQEAIHQIRVENAFKSSSGSSDSAKDTLYVNGNIPSIKDGNKYSGRPDIDKNDLQNREEGNDNKILGRKKLLKKQMGDNIILPLLDKYFEQPEYNQEGYIAESVILKSFMKFPFDFQYVEGNDYIRAGYKNMNFEMSDICLVDRYVDSNGSHYKEVFKGQWIICALDRTLYADLYLNPYEKKRSVKKKTSELIAVKTGQTDFDSIFSAATDNEYEAKRFLTESVISHILQMVKISHGKVYIHFCKEGIVHVAIHNELDCFALNQIRADVNTYRRRWVADLEYIVSLLEEMDQVIYGE